MGKITNEILSSIESYLITHYKFRFNTLKEKPEVIKLKDNIAWRPINKYDLNTLVREIRQLLNIDLTQNGIQNIIESSFCLRVNPIKEYFDNLPVYEGQDIIKELADTITLVSLDGEQESERNMFEKYFKKWMASVVANVYDEFTCRNHTCLVLTGEQGTYKTSWLENLCPKELKNIYLFSGKINPNGKEVQSIIAEYLFCNIDDQLMQLNRKDENDLKELITKNKVSYRRPYGKYIQDYPHICSFMASVNGNDFLTDSTGNRRFLPFEVKSIDIKKAVKIMQENEEQIFSQAKKYAQKGFKMDGQKIDYYITGEDIENLNKRNKRFEFVSYEEDMILKHFHVPGEVYKENDFMSSGEIVNYIMNFNRGEKMNLYRTGKALNKLGFNKLQRDKNGNRVTGWPVHKIDLMRIEDDKFRPSEAVNPYETKTEKYHFKL
jgi:predicted P-loop ATPase